MIFSPLFLLESLFLMEVKISVLDLICSHFPLHIDIHLREIVAPLFVDNKHFEPASMCVGFGLVLKGPVWRTSGISGFNADKAGAATPGIPAERINTADGGDRRGQPASARLTRPPSVYHVSLQTNTHV